MSYLCLTRLPGREEQRIFPQPLHCCLTVAEIKGVMAQVWRVHELGVNIEDVALEVHASIFGKQGAVLVTRDEEWLYIRGQLQMTTEPVMLSFCKLPSMLTTRDFTLQSDSEIAQAKKVAALEQELTDLIIRASKFEHQVLSLHEASSKLKLELRVSQERTQQLERELEAARKTTHDDKMEQLREYFRSETIKVLDQSTENRAAQSQELKKHKESIASAFKQHLKTAGQHQTQHTKAINTQVKTNARHTATMDSTVRNIEETSWTCLRILQSLTSGGLVEMPPRNEYAGEHIDPAEIASAVETCMPNQVCASTEADMPIDDYAVSEDREPLACIQAWVAIDDAPIDDAME